MVDACKNDGPPGSGIDFGPACLVTGMKHCVPYCRELLAVEKRRKG
ncbi:MAG: hypothetical protein ABIJ56_14325 [Pseudomonadota bacterium]